MIGNINPSRPIVKTNVLVCGDCELTGKRRQVLGEIDSRGDILVRRFHGSFTRIISSNFAIKCEECQEIVYQRLGTISAFGTLAL